MELFTFGFMEQHNWAHTCWKGVHLDELQTKAKFTFSSFGSFQLEASVPWPRGRTEDPDFISNMPSIRSSCVGEHTLCLDNEPVTSNTWRTQLCICKSALILLQTRFFYFFFH